MSLISQHFLKQYHLAIHHPFQSKSYCHQIIQCLLFIEFCLVLYLANNDQPSNIIFLYNLRSFPLIYDNADFFIDSFEYIY